MSATLGNCFSPLQHLPHILCVWVGGCVFMIFVCYIYDSVIFVCLTDVCRRSHVLFMYYVYYVYIYIYSHTHTHARAHTHTHT